MPVFGICLGHQILGLAVGLTVDPRLAGNVEIPAQRGRETIDRLVVQREPRKIADRIGCELLVQLVILAGQFGGIFRVRTDLGGVEPHLRDLLGE